MSSVWVTGQTTFYDANGEPLFERYEPGVIIDDALPVHFLPPETITRIALDGRNVEAELPVGYIVTRWSNGYFAWWNRNPQEIA